MILWFYDCFEKDVPAFVPLSHSLVSTGHSMPQSLTPQKSFWVATILQVPSGPTAFCYCHQRGDIVRAT